SPFRIGIGSQYALDSDGGLRRPRKRPYADALLAHSLENIGEAWRHLVEACQDERTCRWTQKALAQCLVDAFVSQVGIFHIQRGERLAIPCPPNREALV